MAITTYATLQTAIITHAMRTGDTEFTSAVPEFITGCEQMLNYGFGDDLPPLRVRDMATSDTITLTSGAGSLPADYLQWIRILTNDDPQRVLEPANPDFGPDAYAGSSSSMACVFDIVGGTITTYPPSTATLDIDYYAKIPALSDTNTSNWLLAKAPLVYLYGSLIAAEPFMMDDARATTYGVLFSKSIKGLMQTDVMSRFARISARVRGQTP